MKKFVVIMALIVSVICAGTITAGVVTGKVLDGSDKSEIIGAVVKIHKASKDSAFVNGATTNESGVFRITGINPGKYVVKVSYTGFDLYTKAFTVPSSGNAVNLGSLEMATSANLLGEVKVTGVKTEIKVMQDTIEYNADSYKTQANAVVEDVLKRLPGVEVDTDGKITANGKSVSKILLDGKEFFADDPTVASKNLPAEIIDKLQVIDRKSDLARLTGVDDGEDETVINLTTKKGMNQGWIGKFLAGYGPDNRYRASGMLNYMRDGNTFTLLGGGNNINQPAFSDGNGERFSRYFGNGNGERKSQSVGFNFNIANQKETFKMGGSVMYSRSDNNYFSRRSVQNLFKNDSTSYSNSNSVSASKSNNVRGDFRIQWDIDTLNTLEFRPNFSFNFSESAKGDTSEVFAGARMPGGWQPGKQVNSSKGIQSSDGKSYEFGGNLVYNHKVKSHPGRSFSIQLRYRYSNVHDDGATLTRNTYYLLDDKDELIDQIYKNHRWSSTIGGRLSWTEPFGDVKNGNFIQTSYNANYRFNNSDKFVYDAILYQGKSTPQIAQLTQQSTIVSMLNDVAFRKVVEETYGMPVEALPLTIGEILAENIPGYEFNSKLSNSFRNDFFTQSMTVGYRKVNKMYNLNLGVTLNSSMSKSEDLINPDRNINSRWVWSVAPFIRLRYKLSETRSLQANYRSWSNQPSLTQLQPVADESNPLNIIVGNPELKPTFQNNFDVRFNDFNMEAQRSMMFGMSGSFSTNSIISRTINNPETGGRITTYDNVNGVWNIRANAMLNFPFRNRKLSFRSFTMLLYNNTKSYVDDNLSNIGNMTFNISPGIAFRNDYVELDLRPTYRMQRSSSNMNSAATMTHRYGARFEATAYTPIGLILNTDMNYSKSTGQGSSYDNQQFVWNASIEYQFLANKKMTIGAKAYDILNQRKNVNRTISENSIVDSETNGLGRYFMFTLSYSFNTFGKGGGNQNAGMDYGGFGGPGRGPGGPGGGPGGGRRF